MQQIRADTDHLARERTQPFGDRTHLRQWWQQNVHLRASVSGQWRGDRERDEPRARDTSALSAD